MFSFGFLISSLLLARAFAFVCVDFSVAFGFYLLFRLTYPLSHLYSALSADAVCWRWWADRFGFLSRMQMASVFTFSRR